ncbi:MAG: hypothetical protein U0800_09680 [Isosphaeraceae bacterium]
MPQATLPARGGLHRLQGGSRASSIRNGLFFSFNGATVEIQGRSTTQPPPRRQP